jgi:hypothetical protein
MPGEINTRRFALDFVISLPPLRAVAAGAEGMSLGTNSPTRLVPGITVGSFQRRLRGKHGCVPEQGQRVTAEDSLAQ